jgi:hypothetical protein
MRHIIDWFRFLVLLSLVVLVGPSCPAPAREAVSPAAARSLDHLVQVVRELDDRRKGTQTVVARLKVVLHTSAAASAAARDREVTLDGAYLGDAQGNMRLRLKHGETLIIDIAFHDETVELWLPRRERFFRGTRNEVLAQGDNDLTLLAVLGNAHDLFFPRAWTARAVERRLRVDKGREFVTVLEGEGSTCRRVKRLALSPTQPVVDQQEILGAAGRTIGCIQYADYQFPGPRAGESTGVPYPGRLILTSKSEQRSLEMIVDELHINTPIPSNKFAVEPPEGQKVLPLGESLSSGKSLWE